MAERKYVKQAVLQCKDMLYFPFCFVSCFSVVAEIPSFRLIHSTPCVVFCLHIYIQIRKHSNIIP